MKPINVVIGVLRNGDQYLFVKRDSNSYNGLWGLPGGKVEAQEHLDDAIVREFREETGLRVHCTAIVGVVSELIIEQKRLEHVILHICLLDSMDSLDDVHLPKSEIRWFAMSNLQHNAQIIPSDILILQKLISSSRPGFYLKLESRLVSPGLFKISEL